MSNYQSIINVCEVISVTDEADGNRIKVLLLPEDSTRLIDDIPYVHPLLPGLIHIKPKVGESVLVITAALSSHDSERFYIGPIIAQPQNRFKDPFKFSSRSLFNNGVVEPEPPASSNPETHGIYGSNNDVGVLGRGNADIFLTDNDVLLRSGVYKMNDITKKDAVFNRMDPAYIKLTYNPTPQSYVSKQIKGGNGEFKSSATIVADQINLITHDSATAFEVTNKAGLISDDELIKIVETAHQLPYGDILIDFLKTFINAFASHTHPFAGKTPCTDAQYVNAVGFDLDKILSKNVRIN